MSTESDGPGQFISLPSGGGALSGLGEKFAPDLHTGTGSFTVPLALPPGRNGFQPSLSLVYSTGSGNGPLGLGWSLGAPGIARRTAKGVPRYDDDDVFVLSGAEDLVRVARPAPGVELYRPRTEGLFARIERHREAGSDYWRVRSPDGFTSVYGTPGAAGADPAAVADPADRARVAAWRLTLTTDPFGNRIEYEYDRDAGGEGDRRWDQLYLRRVRYADYTGAAGETGFLVSVTLVQEGAERPDPFSEHRSGFEVRTRRRWERIEVRTHAGADRLLRSYRLDYLDQRPELAHLLPASGVSLLSRLRIAGHDGDQVEEMAPLELGYTRFEPTSRDFLPVRSADLPARSLAQPSFELVDLFGAGLPDVLEMDGTVRYWRNRGGGRYDHPREMRDAPAGLRLGDPGVQLLDADGDGRTDLLVSEGPLPGYFPLRFGGGWDRRSFQRHRVAPSFSLQDPEVRLVDLDGDGVTDAVRSGNRLECFFNHPTEGWGRTRWVERGALAGLPAVSFADPRVRWADMNGDGLQDLVLVHDGNVEYWPSEGHGAWGARVSMRGSPRFPHGYDPRRVLIGDLDGDGAADLVYVDHRRVLLHLNRSGNGWSEPIEIQGTPPVSDLDSVRLVDLLGNGVSGVLWSTDPGRGGEGLFFLDLTGGVKPYLLERIDNGMGALTRVAYAPSTRFYLEDEARPETRWQTPLPFPVQVVASVEVTDQLSGGMLSSTYRYHHGYWDGHEREFRGFGMVEQGDSERFARYSATVPVPHFAPPVLTKVWFHQGAVGARTGEWGEADYHAEYWPGDAPLLSRPPALVELLARLPRPARRDALRSLRGFALRTEVYAPDGTEEAGRPYTVTERTFALREEEPLPADDPDRRRIFFPYLAAERTSHRDRGDDPMTQLVLPDEHDAFGRPLQTTTVALPRRAARRSPGGADETRILAQHTRTTYAVPDAGLYLHDRVAQERSFELRNPPGVAESAPDDLASVMEEQAAAGLAIHRRFRAALDGWIPGTPLPAAVRLLGHTANHYDGGPAEAFVGRPAGEAGPYGALTRSESLAFTDAELDAAYGAARPAYLGGPSPLPPGAPAGFGAALGYRLEADGADGHHAGYYADGARWRYDFHDPAAPRARGMVLGARDAMGRESTVRLDPYWLLPVEVTDGVGLIRTAGYDYRVLQPRTATDINGNVTEYTFTPLGLLATSAQRGRPGNGEGDQARPGVRMEYGYRAFADSPPGARQPIFVRTVRQVHHDTEIDVPLPRRDETQEVVEYSDGFGRLLQTRTLAEDTLYDTAGADPTVFGDSGLPLDPAAPAASAVGQARPPGDPPNVVVSGWQTYDNKGRPVEKYEPFFSRGWEFAPPTDRQRGQHVTLVYDARGRLARTVSPDGSEEVVVRGIPERLETPRRFAPTPWESFIYDANDNAGRTHPAESARYAHHGDTPSSILLDALGRTLRQTRRTRAPRPPGQPLAPIEEHRTLSSYDVRGDLSSVTDPLGRVALRHHHDLLRRPLAVASIDAGARLMVPDALGNVVEQRDSTGAVLLRSYDLLNRPSRLWACDAAGEALTLRERVEYGDGGHPAQPAAARAAARAANRLGRIVRQFDEGGLVVFEAGDWKGNVLEKRRRAVADAPLLAALAAGTALRVDWAPPAGVGLDEHADTLLDPTERRLSTRFDALSRVKELRYPEGVDGNRALLRPRFHRAGTLAGVTLDGEPFVEEIAYNARAQRLLIAYGNGVMTRYAYDPLMFRLQRLRTEGFQRPAPDHFQPAGPALQDLSYRYDFAGNILRITDRTPGSGFVNNPDAALVQATDAALAQRLAAGDALLRRFAYDPLYRLTRATGREGNDLPTPRPWSDDPRPGFNSGAHGTPDQDNAPNLTRGYWESYSYDPAGNLTRLRHRAGPGADWTRHFGYGGLTPQAWAGEWPGRVDAAAAWPNPPANRLTHVGDDQPAAPATHAYDASGNLLTETASRFFEWDHSDRLRAFRVQAGNAPPTLHAVYLYDAKGQRVKKLVRRGAADYDVTEYVDGFFERHRQVRPGVERENDTLHVMDDQARIAMVRVGPAFPDDGAAAARVRYHLADQVGSSTLAIGGADAAASGFVNREEYFPYGETSFGSFGRKRYRFSGKERDEESGLHFHGARYYAPWLARWTTCDPLGPLDSVNLYLAFQGNPILYADRTGTHVTDGIAGKIGGAADFITGQSSEGRYLFTRGAGWLDRAHTFDHAEMAISVLQSLMKGESARLELKGLKVDYGKAPLVLSRSGLEQLTVAIIHDFDIQFEHRQGRDAADGAFAASDFSYEDLPSNRVGVEIGLRFLREAEANGLDVLKPYGELLKQKGAPELLNAVRGEVISELSPATKEEGQKAYRGFVESEYSRIKEGQPRAVDPEERRAQNTHRLFGDYNPLFRTPRNYSSRPVNAPPLSPIDEKKVPFYLQSGPEEGSNAGLSTIDLQRQGRLIQEHAAGACKAGQPTHNVPPR